MNGDELRAARMELGLFQGRLADQIQALGITLEDGQKVGQPEVSSMERGKVPVPAALEAAIREGRIARGADSPPLVGGAATAGGGSGGRGSGKRKGRARDAEPPPPPPPADAEPPPPPAEPRGDVPPAPVAEPAGEQPRAGDVPPGPLVKPPPPPLDPAARNALERDLRNLFAGQTFLVPIVVGHDEQGAEVVQHHEGTIPGIAQVVGMLDARDGRVIELHATAMARAWADLAAENAFVRRLLIGLTYGGAWRGVIAATLPVAMAIAANHGVALPGLSAAAPASAPPPPHVDGNVVQQL